ncbi:hypothetical protein ACIRN5_23290 [Lysinibacillus fusiformis]|uniref:hypothetical protein n=1 Tax=Lysinibacillus fusiformis TaxID=28031 RepID=UPI00382237DD
MTLPSPITTVSATELARILAQTAPHRADSTVWSKGAATLLDVVELRLHAVTTDRTAIAVGTAHLHETSGAWHAVLRDTDADALHQWASSRGHDEDVRLVSDGQRLDAHTAGSGLHLPVSTAYPVLDWRARLAPYLRNATASPAGLDTDALRRWSTSGDTLWLDATKPATAVVIRGERFVGLQMATKQTVPAIRVPGTDPATPLGSAPALPLPDRDSHHTTLYTEMLKRVITSEEAVTDARQAQDGWAATAHIHAAGSAYVANRLLAELEQYDPRRAYHLAAQLREELDLGEFTDIAREIAYRADLDPAAWRDEYRRRKDASLSRT